MQTFYLSFYLSPYVCILPQFSRKCTTLLLISLHKSLCVFYAFLFHLSFYIHRYTQVLRINLLLNSLHKSSTELIAISSLLIFLRTHSPYNIHSIIFAYVRSSPLFILLDILSSMHYHSAFTISPIFFLKQ